MKVCIIGPEGSGKTVLATMIDYYLENHPESGLASVSGDLSTKLYFDKIKKKLQHRVWPGSTTPGSPVILSWKWKPEKADAVEVKMLDVAGQDYRQEIEQDDSSVMMKQEIKESNLILVLCDLFGHDCESEEYTNSRRAENGFMIEWVLSHATVKQHVIFIVTKADLFEKELPEGKWGDRDAIESLVKKYMREFNWHGYKDHLKRCSLFAVSAVSVSDDLKEGDILRVPKTPLQSRGMDNLIAELRKVIEINAHARPGPYSGRDEPTVIVNTPIAEFVKNKIESENPLSGLLKAVGFVLCPLIVVVMVRGCG